MSTPSIKRFLANAWEIAEIILIALVTVYVIRTFIAQPFLVSGASMEPNFENGNYLIIDETTYYFREPTRGEVVVFRFAGDGKSFFIKRIIGLPNETIRISGNQIKISNGDEIILDIKEAYLPEDTITEGEREIHLGEDEYFVMGDNRRNSFDSRNWGPLNKEDIVGLVRLRVFPFSDISTFKAPSY